MKNIGSISHGTLRNEDLIPTFLACLKEQKNLSFEQKEKIAIIEFNITGGQSYWDDESQDDLEELFDILNEYAPPYFYFGSHEGDGADFGFWLSQDWGESFDGLKVNDTSKVPEDYFGEVIHVNDHGNVTLYSAQEGILKEVWALT